MKKILIVLTLILIIAIFLFFKNQPEMKVVKENDIWDFFVEKDFKDSKYLQATLSQKSKNDTITVNDIKIIDNQSNKTVISYDTYQIKNSDVEGYNINLKPFTFEFPLGIKVEKGRPYTLKITYILKDATYTDEIEFK